MKSRRQVLVSVGALLGSGCLSESPSSPSTETATNPSNTDRSTESETASTPECYETHVVETEAFDPPEQLPVGVREPVDALLDRAIENESVEIETYGEVPIDSGVYVEVDGEFFRTHATLLDSTDVPARNVDAEWESGQEPPAETDILLYEELPESDQRVLDLVIYGPRYERTEHPSSGLRTSAYPAPYPDGTSTSRLVEPEESWVEWDERFYRVRVGGETTNTRRSFEISASTVASTDEEFSEYATEEYVEELEDLSPDAQAVLDEAIEDQYRECEPPSAGYEELDGRLEALRALPGRSENRWYVRYGDDRYLIEFSGWVI